MHGWWRGVGVVAAAVTLSAGADAAVAVLTDPGVPQYAEAAKAAQAELGQGARLFDASSPSAATALAAARPEVVLAVGQKAVRLAVERLPETPVVYCLVLARNVPYSRWLSGIPLEASAETQLEAFRKVHPGMRKLALVYEPEAALPLLEEANLSAFSEGLELTPRAVRAAGQLRPVITGLPEVDAVWLLPDPHLFSPPAFQATLAALAKRGIAVFGFQEAHTEAGALASLSADFKEEGRMAGRMAAEIAARGADKRLPMPPHVHGRGLLSVNLRVAAELKVEVPEGVLASAKVVGRAGTAPKASARPTPAPEPPTPAPEGPATPVEPSSP